MAFLSLLMVGALSLIPSPAIGPAGEDHPVEYQPGLGDVCMDIVDSKEYSECIATGGSTCTCSNGTGCDQSITTESGLTLTKTGCTKGSFMGYGGLKCFYWNPVTKKNEERIIRC